MLERESEGNKKAPEVAAVKGKFSGKGRRQEKLKQQLESFPPPRGHL